MKHFLQAYYLAPLGIARRRLAWQLVRNSSSAARKDKSCAILNKKRLFAPRQFRKPGILKLTLRKGQSNFSKVEIWLKLIKGNQGQC